MLFQPNNCHSPKISIQMGIMGNQCIVQQKGIPIQKISVSESQRNVQLPKNVEQISNVASTEVPDRTNSFEKSLVHQQSLSRTKSDTLNMQCSPLASPFKKHNHKNWQTQQKDFQKNMPSKLMKTEENDLARNESALSSLDLDFQEQVGMADQTGSIYLLDIEERQEKTTNNQTLKYIKTVNNCPQDFNNLQLKILERLKTIPQETINKFCKIQIIANVHQEEFEFKIDIGELPYNIQIKELKQILINIYLEHESTYQFKNAQLSMLVGKLKTQKIDESLRLFELLNMAINRILEFIILEDKQLDTNKLVY